MSELIDDEEQTLEGFAVEEQVFLWDDLGQAIDHALNLAWSLRCDGLVSRIIDAARLVGPSPLRDVPWRLATGGVYAAVLAAGGVDVPDVSEDQWRGWERLMAEFGDRETNRARYKDTLDAIDRQSRLGEWS